LKSILEKKKQKKNEEEDDEEKCFNKLLNKLEFISYIILLKECSSR
jgi:hypothetical protein